MNTLTVRIPDQLRADLLKEISSRQSVPISDLVRESIRRYVAIERFRSLRKRTLPFAEAQGLLTKRGRLPSNFMRIVLDASVVVAAFNARSLRSGLRTLPRQPHYPVEQGAAGGDPTKCG